jgi:aspartyl-tRNA(Asn)/glutamyl-tRNA(Gln) amidotransferase subunit A
MCYAALGSDTGGSIRVPASLCGIVGLKPTYGRVSKRGVVPLSFSLDHIGPMARSARDCALVLQAIAGYDAQDECSVDAPVGDYTSNIDAGLKGVRIGVANLASEAWSSDVSQAFDSAVKQLEGLGAETMAVDTSSFGAYHYVGGVVLLSEAAAYHRERIAQQPQDFGEDVRMRLLSGMDQKAADYIRAMQFMRELRRTCDEMFLRDADLLVMPTTIIAAPRADSVTLDDPTVGLSRLTLPTDSTGQPAMSVPCGFTDSGLPLGLMIVGRHFDEATVLRAAHAFEQAAGVSSRHPPVD